ncbi:MAG: hypothetical protein ABIL09_12600, partial [Gemmatimonadota bacterium]
MRKADVVVGEMYWAKISAGWCRSRCAARTTREAGLSSTPRPAARFGSGPRVVCGRCWWRTLSSFGLTCQARREVSLRRGDEEIDLLEDEEVAGGPDGADEAPDGKAEDAAVEAAEDQGGEAPAEDQAPAPDDAEAPPEGGAVAGKKKGSKKKGSKKAAKPKAPKEPKEPKAPKEAVDLGPLKKAAVEAEKAYRHAVEAA